MKRMSDQSLKAAKEAAAKVNAMLVATGQLRPSDLNKGRTKSGKSADLFVEEVIINDAPMSARNFLTRSFTQEEISKMSGASVSTRGRYMTKEEIETNTTSDRPLYLHIQGVNQQDVKVAVGRIMHLIMEHTHRKNLPQKPKGHKSNSSGSSSWHNERSSPNLESVNNSAGETDQIMYSQNVIREKVFLPSTVGLNIFDVKQRLMGDNNSNLKYIQDETGATLLLRGIGSGYIEPSIAMESQEPLHFFLEHNMQEKFNEAKDLVVNLAQTILTQIHQEQSSNQVTQQTFQQNIPLNTPGIIPAQVPPAFTSRSNQQIVVSAVGQQLVPPQVNLHMNSLPVAQGASPLIVAPEGVAPSPAIHNQQVQEISHAAVAPGTHLVQISVPSSVQGLVSQHVVQAPAAASHFVQLPQGTQIVTTPEGPRLVSLAPPSSVSTTYITPTIYGTTAGGEQQASVGIVIPQHVPQPVPPVSRAGECAPVMGSYTYEAEVAKLSTTPTVISSTPTSTTFAYMQPPPTLEQDILSTQPPSIAMDTTHWHPTSNSQVLPQVSAPQMEFASQNGQTQVTYIQTSYASDSAENINPHLAQPQPIAEPRTDWNSVVRPHLPMPTYSQESTGNVMTTSFTEESENDERGSKGFMWAQYPQGESDPHRLPPPPHRDLGGVLKQESDEVIASSNRELAPHEDVSSPQQEFRWKTTSSGSLMGEYKRRRSFKPKGDFGTYNQTTTRELEERNSLYANYDAQRGQAAVKYREKESVSGQYGEVAHSELPIQDASGAPPNFVATVPPPSVGTTVQFSPEYPPPVHHPEETVHHFNAEVPLNVPPPELPPNPWQWETSVAPATPVSYPPPQTARQKNFGSPWESGIPGVPANFQQANRYRGSFYRSRFNRNRRF